MVSWSILHDIKTSNHAMSSYTEVKIVLGGNGNQYIYECFGADLKSFR